MKHAILIHADGTTEVLDGKFILLTQLATNGPLGVVSKFKNGKLLDTIVCNTLRDALALIIETARDWKRRA